MLIDVVFNQLKVCKVIVNCDINNVDLEKVMKKLRMTLSDDKGIRYCTRTGVTSGEYLYAMSKDEYLKNLNLLS